MSEKSNNPEETKPVDAAAQVPQEGPAEKQGKGPKQAKEGGKGRPQGKGAKGGEPKAKKAEDATPRPPAQPPRLRDKFRAAVAAKVGQEFGIQNRMALPRIDKVILNVGLGKQLEGTKLNPKAKQQVVQDLTVITGQKPVMCVARKSVANFKLRAGYEIGAMVTLRGQRMWEFIDRLINLAIPRIKDFRGLNPSSFDAGGSYSFGVTEQGLFPEVNMAEAEFTHGMHITFVFRNSDKAKSLFVLKELGVPFAKPEDLNKKN